MIVKKIHIISVALSFTLFIYRGGLMLLESPRLRQKWLKITPHVVDTVLLASAIGLSVILQQYPFVHGWLTAKVFALIAYIVLGSIALKHGKSRPVRAVAFSLAVLVFLYIVSVARLHQPLGFFLFLSG